MADLYVGIGAGAATYQRAARRQREASFAAKQDSRARDEKASSLCAHPRLRPNCDWDFQPIDVGRRRKRNCLAPDKSPCDDQCRKRIDPIVASHQPRQRHVDYVRRGAGFPARMCCTPQTPDCHWPKNRQPRPSSGRQTPRDYDTDKLLPPPSRKRRSTSTCVAYALSKRAAADPNAAIRRSVPNPGSD